MSWIAKENTYLSESEQLKNAQLVANHFVGSDWTKESLSALIGNMSHESTLNPDLSEMGYAWADDRGYGLVQWTPRSKYWDWAVSEGLDPRNGDSQLSRIDYEVEKNIQWIATSKYNVSFKDFRQNTGKWDVDYLTEMFTWCYERPNQYYGEESLPKRIAFAQKVYKEIDFKGTGSNGGSGSGSGGSGESGGSETSTAIDKIFHLWLSGVMRW